MQRHAKQDSFRIVFVFKSVQHFLPLSHFCTLHCSEVKKNQKILEYSIRVGDRISPVYAIRF